MKIFWNIEKDVEFSTDRIRSMRYILVCLKIWLWDFLLFITNKALFRDKIGLYIWVWWCKKSHNKMQKDKAETYTINEEPIWYAVSLQINPIGSIFVLWCEHFENISWILFHWICNINVFIFRISKSRFLVPKRHFGKEFGFQIVFKIKISKIRLGILNWKV